MHNEEKAEGRKKRVMRHFRRVDSLIHRELVRMEWEILNPTEKPAGYFRRLCREIISQQLGSGAARAITARFTDLFPDKRPTPDSVLAISEDRLRAVGMSWAKARSLRDLAMRATAGDIAFGKFARADDEEIITELTRVRGIGRWTAEMFLIFNLLRPDVLPLDDLGLQKAVRLHYFDGEGVARERIRELGATWAPWRSVATWYLWRSLDPVPVEY